MKAGKIFSIVCLLLLCSWTFQSRNDIQKAEWLIGTWESKSFTGKIYETWAKTGENEFSGKSFMLKKSDTLIFEMIRIVNEKDGMFYIPIVKSQNDGMPVRFALKEISDSKMIFENPAHDFPQVISYIKISDDSLVAEISGVKNKKLKKETFPMRRVK